MHVMGTGYDPKVYKVHKPVDDGPPEVDYGSVQAAIDAWEADSDAHARGGLIMIYPNDVSPTNVEGAYFENLVMG